MSKQKHQGHIEDDFVLDGYSTAICSCGWSSDPAIDPSVLQGVMQMLSCVGMGGTTKRGICVDLGSLDEAQTVFGSDWMQLPDHDSKPQAADKKRAKR